MALAGPVSLLVIAQNLSVEAQGYYYTFASIIALQIFAELGFGQVLLNHCSHEWVKLSISKGVLKGPEINKQNLAALIKKSVQWYIAGAIFILAIVMPVGLALMAAQVKTTDVGWTTPWIVTALVTSVNFALSPVWHIMSACGKILTASFSRTIIAIVSNIGTWGIILLGGELYASAVAASISGIGAAIIIKTNYHTFFRPLFSAVALPKKPAVALSSMQLRLGLSTVASYLMYNLFTPVAFHYQGAAEAARIGMGLALANAISGVASAVIESRAPLLASLVASGRKDDLKSNFSLSIRLAGVIAVSLGLVTWSITLWVLSGYPIAERVPQPIPLAFLLAAVVSNQMIGAMNTYMRAHREEPTMGVSIFASILTGAATWFSSAFFPAGTALVAYGLIVTFVQLPSVLLILREKERQWHNPPRIFSQ